jgi:hypothetical protein
MLGDLLSPLGRDLAPRNGGHMGGANGAFIVVAAKDYRVMTPREFQKAPVSSRNKL